MESGADSGVSGESADSNGEFLRCFGRQMKLLREAAGLTQAQLGDQVGYGEAQIAAVEQGRRIPKPELIDGVDRAVSARGVLLAMKEEVAKARYPGSFPAVRAAGG
ncbi:helix-turn-helix transcriptional regulator [Streptomyces hirsutus]